MPVRKRRDRRKQAAGLEEWWDVFETEFDFSGDLPDAGVETDAYGRPDREVARAAWQRLGAEFMRTLPLRHPALGPPWALAEFGDPL